MAQGTKTSLSNIMVSVHFGSHPPLPDIKTEWRVIGSDRNGSPRTALRDALTKVRAQGQRDDLDTSEINDLYGDFTYDGPVSVIVAQTSDGGSS